MSFVNGTFIITNIIGVYSIYKLINIFYVREDTNQYVEFASYSIYYFVGCLIFVMMPIPIVLLIFNILFIFCITFNYSRMITRNMLVTTYVYLIIFCVEIVIMALFEYKRISIFEIQELESIYLIVLVKVATYILSLILSERKVSIEKSRDIPLLYWIGIISIPVSTLFIILLFLDVSRGKEQFHIMILLLIVIIIDIVGFQLYKNTVDLLNDKNKKLLLQRENQCYLEQLRMIQKDNRDMSIIRHDIKNHLITMNALYNDGEIRLYKSYLESLLSKIDNNETLCRSGNTVIDAIVNYKLKNLLQLDVKMDLDIYAPNKFSITDVDLTSLLGNLIDNSVRAVKETESDRYLKISMNYNKGVLLLEIKNSYKTIIKSDAGTLCTTKQEKNSHGIGLESVKQIIEKYDGILQLQFDDKYFIARAILYC